MFLSLFNNKVLVGDYGADVVRLKEIEIADRALPAVFDGYRILFISDLHIKKVTGLYKGLNLLIKGLGFDVLVIGGDTKQKKGSVDAAVRGIRLVLDGLRVPDGVFSVLGNHEIKSEVLPAFETAGINVLANSNRRIMRDGSCIYIAGVDDMRYNRGSLSESLRGIPGDAFKIVVCHSPDIIGRIRKSENLINLVLSGHTHGGQVRFPYLGALFTETQVLCRQNAWGLMRENGLPPLYVTSGVGTTSLPIRLLCNPEVVLITLRRNT